MTKLLPITLLLCSMSMTHAALKPRIETMLKSRIASAYQRGDLASSQQLLSNLIEKLSDEEIASADQCLKEAKAPPLAELVLDARMTDVLANGNKLRKPSARETELAMPVLHQRIAELTTEVQELEFFADELPTFDAIQDYQDAFWELHVTENRLKNADHLARYGQTFVKQSRTKKETRKASLKKESDDTESEVSYDFAAQRADIRRLLRDLPEIKAELRIAAVTRATEIVRESKDFKERLRAAYVADFDGQQVIDFLRTHVQRGTKFKRPSLSDSNTLSAVLAAMQFARETSGDLVIKSRLLHQGMHWWMRGRYGEGPMGAGLLKSPMALASPMAQFPLYMPMSNPKPVDPTMGYSVPKFDRRHHYIWMYEYRNIISTEYDKTKTLDKSKTTSFEATSRTKLSRFY